MTDIVDRLRSAAKDKDNMPRMKSETWLPVGLGLEAADEIERLRRDAQPGDGAWSEVERLKAENARQMSMIKLGEESHHLQQREIDRLKAENEVLRELSEVHSYD